jgi:hypothetical protein
MNSGISGIVFTSGGLHWSNSADKETNFVSEVDNQSTTAQVKNFIVGAVFGKNGKPNGIIQFINKCDEN